MKSVEISKCNKINFHLIVKFLWTHKGGKNARGIRVSSYDPDESSTQPQNNSTSGPDTKQQPNSGGQSKSASITQPPTLGSTRKFSQKVSTISQNYNEKSMLLSSDEEYQ